MSVRRYRYDKELGEVVEVRGDEPRGPGRVELMLDSKYEGLRATDGTDVSSRRKWQAYARQHNLAHVEDFDKGYWPKKAKERDAMTRGDWGQKERTQAVVEAMRRVEAGYKPRRQPMEGPDGTAPEVVREFFPNQK